MPTSAKVNSQALREALLQVLAVVLCLIIMLPAVLLIYLGVFLAFVLGRRFMRVANGTAQVTRGRSVHARATEPVNVYSRPSERRTSVRL